MLLAANLYVLAAQRLGVKDPAVLGLRSAVVLTGSMSGAIEPDDLVVTHAETAYAAGDIICRCGRTSCICCWSRSH